ncbi:MAG: MFS transporter [Nitrososphaerota archaeon]|nr:MFS transporter [Nitrososphaerota archaeon]
MKAEDLTATTWLSRDVLLISLSAFFADIGYQAVTAVFPLLIVIELKEPAYVYGLLLALSYGLGSLFSLVGGRLGDRYSKKKLSLIGNLLIPLMSVSVIFQNILLTGALFVFGWWARYFRTPARRAWLVEVSNPAYRSKIFGFLHALDVGGGMIAVVYSVILVLLKTPMREIIGLTMIPLLVSSLSLGIAGTRKHEAFEKANRKSTEQYATQNEIDSNHNELDQIQRKNDFVFRAVLVSAMFFGFSYYALGFPIVTVTESQGSAVLGIITFGIYLGVSALAGFSLGSLRGKRPFRTLWSLGYMIAAVSSLIIGTSLALHYNLGIYYLGAAGLGFATGSVETFEPVLTSTLISTGMGWLSSSRAIGLFVSNIVMGILFVYSQFDSYLYAALTAFVAGSILLAVEIKMKVK